MNIQEYISKDCVTFQLQADKKEAALKRPHFRRRERTFSDRKFRAPASPGRSPKKPSRTLMCGTVTVSPTGIRARRLLFRFNRSPFHGPETVRDNRFHAVSRSLRPFRHTGSTEYPRGASPNRSLRYVSCRVACQPSRQTPACDRFRSAPYRVARSSGRPAASGHRHTAMSH